MLTNPSHFTFYLFIRCNDPGSSFNAYDIKMLIIFLWWQFEPYRSRPRNGDHHADARNCVESYQWQGKSCQHHELWEIMIHEQLTKSYLPLPIVCDPWTVNQTILSFIKSDQMMANEDSYRTILTTNWHIYDPNPWLGIISWFCHVKKFFNYEGQQTHGLWG